MPETITASWHMIVGRRDLIDAIGIARARPTLRRKDGAFEPDVVLAACEGGLSVRSSNSAMDMDGSGVWVSPIAVSGPALRRLAPKLDGAEVVISFADDRLAFNGTVVPAREI